MSYYELTLPDGRDFYTGAFNYARALKTGEIIRHPSPVIDPSDDSTYFSISVTPGDTFGIGTVDSRLFVVQPVGGVKQVWEKAAEPQTNNWRGVSALRVVQERPVTDIFGQNAASYAAFLELVLKLTPSSYQALARSYRPLPSGVGRDIWERTRNVGVFCAAYMERQWLSRHLGRIAAEVMTAGDAKKAVTACADAAWAVITQNLIPAEFTALLIQPWWEVFGASAGVIKFRRVP